VANDIGIIELEPGLPIRVEMETIEDTFEKALAKYDYPYVDGVDIEDMGQKAHVMKLRTYWYDDVDHLGYDDHILLINSLEGKNKLDFTHPKYGLMKVSVESLSVRHDDKLRSAEIDMTLIEQMRGAIQPLMLPSIKSSAEEAYIKAQQQQELKLAEDIKKKIPGADAVVLSKTFDSSLGLLAQAQEYSTKTRDFIGQVEKYIELGEGLLNQVENPVNTLQFAISYSENLPGVILGSLAVFVEKVAVTFDNLRDFPSRFLDNVQDGLDDLQDAFDQFNSDDNSEAAVSAREVMSEHLQNVGAQRYALEAAYTYSADDEAAKDADSEIEVMNIRELETSLATARDMLQTAIETAREMDSLKEMAEALLEHVNKVRLDREKMVGVELDNPMPLHLVCLKYGLSHKDAERLLKVNKKVRNPNFTSGEILVYAR
jgi:prophage DNA circulation protein